MSRAVASAQIYMICDYRSICAHLCNSFCPPLIKSALPFNTYSSRFLKTSIGEELLKKLHCSRSQQFTMEIHTSSSSSSVVCVISPQSSGFCLLLRNKAALQPGQTSGCVSPAAPTFNLGAAHTEMGFEGAVCSSGQGRAELRMCNCEETHPGGSPRSPQWKGVSSPHQRSLQSCRCNYTPTSVKAKSI